MRDRSVAPELIVLDVGHGNTTVIRSSVVVVVDAAPGRALVEELQRVPVDRVDHLILSHADKDHIGGAIAAMSQEEFSVTKLWLNPDAEKDSDTWGDLLAFAAALNRKGRLSVATSLNCGASPICSSNDLSVEVLHPDVELAGHGPVRMGGKFGTVSANGASGVLKVTMGGRPAALLAGDANQYAVQRMIDQGQDLSADVLIFPHHGGHCDGDDYSFAKSLCEAVQPQAVVFSLGRSGLPNPQPDIVRGVRDGASGARILCTQLSRRCRSRDDGLDTLAASSSHWLPLPSSGAPRHARCAGTLRIQVSEGDSHVFPAADDHRAFIMLAAPTSLCMGVSAGP